MEASTVGQTQSVTITTDAQGNGVQEVQGVTPDRVLDPQFDQEDAQGDLSVESSTDGNAAIRVTGAPANTSVTVTYTSAQDQSGAGVDEEKQNRLNELQRLKSDGIISDDEYNSAVERVNADQPLQSSSNPATAWGNMPGQNMPPSPTTEQLSQAAAEQSPGEPQVVPEVRPQAAVSPSSEAGISEASKRMDAAGPHGQEEIDRANSEEAKQASVENSRRINLPEGQRVVITGDHPEEGRMAYVLGIHYTDGIQDMIARSGTSEARFADVDHYVLRTRDGRSDLLTATPDQVKAIEENQGWGRGQI